MIKKETMDFGEVLDLIRERMKEHFGDEVAALFNNEYAIHDTDLKEQIEYLGDSLFEYRKET